MKLMQEERDVRTSVSQEGRFKIAENAKAFKALIDGLYSRKAESITREIWSNAYDAHTERGNEDRPFSVTFPSLFNNEFRVRDYGYGLSHEDVMGLYTTVFQSTKEDTNSQTGKWGLGSKSPFSYTDTYGVTSWHDGKRRVYSAVIGRDGVPTINLMHEEDSDDETGLEVTFPVDAKDVQSFRDAAEWVSLAYDPIPEGFEPKKRIKYDIDKKGLYKIGKFYDKNGNPVGIGYNEITVFAKMGTVLYSIKPNDYVSSSEITTLTKLCGRDDIIILPFKVGELEITLSREELSFGKDEPTADSIKKRISEVSDVILEDTLEVVNKFKTLEEANKYFRSRVSHTHLMKQYFTSADSIVKFNTDSNLEKHDPKKPQYGNAAVYKEGRFTSVWGKLLNSHILTELNQFSFAWIDHKATANAKITKTNYSTYDPIYRLTTDPILIISDQRKGAPQAKHNARRVHKYLTEKGFSQASYVEITDDNEREALDQIKTYKSRRAKENRGTIFTHEIDYTHPKKGRSRVKLRELKGNGSFRGYDTTLEPEEFDEGGYYLRMFRNDIQDGTFKENFLLPNWKSILGLSPDDKVVIVPKTMWSRFDKDPDWINLDVTAKEVINSGEYKRLVNLKHCITAKNRISNIINSSYNSYTLPFWPSRHINAIRPTYEKLEKITASITMDDLHKINSVRADAKESGHLVSYDRIIEAISKERSSLFPLLSKLYGWNKDTVRQYENLVMNQKGKF